MSFEIALADAPEGSLLSLVGAVSRAGHASWCRTLWHGDGFQLRDVELSAGIWTVFDFQLVAKSHGIFCPTSSSMACLKPPRTIQGFRNLVELCSGMGGIAAGASVLGYQAVFSVDKSPLACAAVRASGGLAVEGDVCSLDIQRKDCELCKDQGTLPMAGCPCQPYSSLGRKLGLRDVRGQTLGYI